MNFGWNPEQRQLYEQTLEFARKELRDHLTAAKAKGQLPRAAWLACGRHGLLGLSVPEGQRGLGLDALTTALLVEAFGRGCEDFGFVFSACAHLFACAMPIAENAGDAILHTVVPRLSQGEWIGANAITESGAGSDAFSLSTRARRDGDHFVLDGVKSYVTNGPDADVFLVYATENPDWGHLGVAAFVVERFRSGLTVGTPFEKMGLETSPVSSIYLDGCRIPLENRLGRGGDGAKIFHSSMLWERACLFAAYLGAMERQLEATISFVKERKQFRKRLSKHQAVAHRIADMKVRLESARLLLYRACWAREAVEDHTLEVSMAKLAVSEAAVASSLDAIHLHGGSGVLCEMGVERFLRDAIPGRIFSGTSEIQRDLIASKLGL